MFSEFDCPLGAAGGAYSSVPKLLQRLQKSPDVAFVTEYAGSFRFGIGIFARSASSAWEKFSTLVRESGVSVLRKSTATRTALFEIPRGHLSSIRHFKPVQISGAVDSVEELNPAEEARLSLLAAGTTTSYRDAARTLGVPHSSFMQRLTSLKDRKIFLGRFASVNTQALGMGGCKVLIYATGFDPRFFHDLRTFVFAHPYVSHFVESFGEWDFEVNLDTRSPQDVTAFAEQLYTKFPRQISDLLPLPVAASHKRRFFPEDRESKDSTKKIRVR